MFCESRETPGVNKVFVESLWSCSTFESCLLALSCWRRESNCTCTCACLWFCSAVSCCAACLSACSAATCCWRDKRRCRKTAWDFDILFLVFCRETPEGGGEDTMLHSVSVNLLIALNSIMSYNTKPAKVS